MMYVKTTVTLEDCDGNEDEYEVGAEVDDAYDNYGGREVLDGCDVGEPDISAAGLTLDQAWLWPHPQEPGILADGWSAKVEDALAEAYYDLDRDLKADRDEYDDTSYFDRTHDGYKDCY